MNKLIYRFGMWLSVFKWIKKFSAEINPIVEREVLFHESPLEHSIYIIKHYLKHKGEYK